MKTNRIEDLEPITLKERIHPKVYQAIYNGEAEQLEDIFLGATDRVLTLMLENNLTMVPERKAVWCNFGCYMPHGHFGFMNKAGDSFPDEAFGENCKIFCQEKTARTGRNMGHSCSHESRDPKNGKWGGSAEITFQLISIKGLPTIAACYGACSGLKEWEDLTLELGKYYYLGLIKLNDEQVQEILRRADESVKDDPTGRPKGTTITNYVENVFYAIDAELGRLTA